MSGHGDRPANEGDPEESSAGNSGESAAEDRCETATDGSGVVGSIEEELGIGDSTTVEHPSTDRGRRSLLDGLPDLFVPALLGAFLLVYFALPFVTFFGRTGSVGVAESLADPAVRTAIGHSLVTAPIATAIATVFGVPLAYVLARGSFRGRRLIEALVVLPLVVPPVVGGAMLLTAVGRFTPIGSVAAGLGVPLTDSLLGVILAQTFVAGPFVVISARAGFGAIDVRYEEVARSLGHGPISTFRRVSLPMARGAIVAGIVLTFVRAIGEFGATMMVAYNPRTMPTWIWVTFVAEGIDAVVPIALALLAITLAVVAALQWFGRTPGRDGGAL